MRAARRGTTGNFKRGADGSDKRFGFCLPPNERGRKTVIVFESPIDALRHKALFRGVDCWRRAANALAKKYLGKISDNERQLEQSSGFKSALYENMISGIIDKEDCISYPKNRHGNIIEIGHPIFKVRLNSRFVMGVADFSIILGGRFFA
ncbi:MAG: hypothetical protein LBK41_03050 [Clostridiales bacterium]|nr:hypothetical protein [Clostridiales bacterium]